MDPFQTLQRRFPDLTFTKIDAPVDEAFTIPVQPGLRVEVRVNRQNGDELHLTIGNIFWCEWFPMTRPEVSQQFLDAVSDFIEGRARVIEIYRGKRPFGADLEKQSGNDWQRIARYRRFTGLFSLGRLRKVVVQNIED